MSVPLSIIICTRNRVDSLRLCVRALACIETDYEWELVIVDNGSTDNTGAFLASLPRKINNASVIMGFEPKRGLAAARNKGLSQARGDVIAFTDDDCYTSKNYVDAMISSFELNSEIGFVGGRVLLYDQSDLKMTIEEREDYFVLQPRTFIAAGTIQGANMAFRKAVLDRIRGFDECLGAGTPFACEDIDAVAAASWAGIVGAYDPRPTVYHHHRRKTKLEKNELRKTYDKGAGAYYVKYILRRDSRSKYLKTWIRFAIRRSINGNLRQRCWAMRQSLRELLGGFHYAVTRLISTRADIEDGITS
jgi:glycosyltransferase involved in cell wall biosynthesis